MATANVRVQCSICNKGNTTYICRGCSNDFCFQHLTEHRQIPNRQLDEIINDHDQFQQTIIQQKQNSSLIQQINQWEANSILQIQQTAKECRETTMKLTQKSIDNIEKKFTELSQKLKEIRQENEFNEIDLNHFQLKLKHITEELLKKIQTKKIKFQQFATTVAGGNGEGQKLNQLDGPQGIFIENDKSIYIADTENHRIVKWKSNSNTGQIIASGNGKGNQNYQLNDPIDLIFDKNNNSFIVSDAGNGRVIRYFDQNQHIIISNIVCYGLTIDKNGFIYVSDLMNNEVRRWKQGDIKGELVAGGNGQGNSLKQLSFPRGVIVDHLGQIYVADRVNNRVMRWCEEDAEGKILVSGNGEGNESSQLYGPTGLSFDNEENLYAADEYNQRIQKYEKL
ncbi:unnamed protein product [Adineta steineri]|uniref:Uncharacterized protein n=1 Tax=Adineta steineri TaxID=433720 RepID=A0A814JNN2_9BILA|nr:unnamed protein product [Adineta steineri]CAF1103492.1 unnamed protein product [Adineta steineri]